MNKWIEYGSYEKWVYLNKQQLTDDHKKEVDENYNWVEPDTYRSFDDFCLGTWQSMN